MSISCCKIKIRCGYIWQVASFVKVRKTTIVLGLLFSLFNLIAPPVVAQLKIDFSGKGASYEVPFQISPDGVILLKVMINDVADTAIFILDTGHPGIAIDSFFCDRYNIPISSSEVSIQGIGGIRKLFYTNNINISINRLKFTAMDCHVSDYSGISMTHGIRIDGIVGNKLFEDAIVVVNYDIQKVFIYPCQEYVYPKQGKLMYISMKKRLPLQQVGIIDSLALNSSYYFDTGAGLDLMLSHDAAVNSNLFYSTRKRMPVTIAGFGGKVNLLVTVIKKLELEGYVFRKVPVHLLSDSASVGLFNYPDLVGILGNGILKRFNCIINYKANEIFIKRNKNFNSPFEYGYTGLDLNVVNNEIVVGEVLDGTPAYKAGFRENDLVVAINNNFSKEIKEYTHYLLEIGMRNTILINRNGNLMKLNLTVQSIK
jgi:hypothetical protein